MTVLTQEQREAEWVEIIARAAYEDWIAPVRDLEPAWDDLPESHRDRLRTCQRAALAAVLPVLRAAVLEEAEAAFVYDAHSGEGWSFYEAEEPVKWKDIAWAARRRVRALAKEPVHAD